MEAFVREKRFWIYTKLAEKEALRPTIRPRLYVSGEGFPYLGRSHRLLLVAKQDVALKLEHGRFKMRRVDAPRGRELMIDWYTRHAKDWLEARIARLAARVGVTRPGVFRRLPELALRHAASRIIAAELCKETRSRGKSAVIVPIRASVLFSAARALLR